MNLTIITNGNLELGYGHISRTLAIAGSFYNNGNNVQFIVDHTCSFVDKIQNSRYKSYAIDFNDQKKILDALESFQTDIVLIDCVEENFNILSYLSESKYYLVSITLFFFDINNRYENISFFPSIEQGETICIKDKLKIYKGRDYLVFNDEFTNYSEKEFNSNPSKVLFTMGGTDPFNITYKFFNALKKLEKFNFLILLSELNEHYKEISEDSKKTNNTQVLSFASNMPELMHDSDLIILNGGITRYEASLTKTPFIAISIHETQFNITKQITDLGVGLNLGIYDELNDEDLISSVKEIMLDNQKRFEMSQNMGSLLDAKGAHRIYDTIIQDFNNFNEKVNKVC